MKRQTFTAFDEYIPAGSNASNAVFTSSELNSRLAAYDILAIQVVIDNVSGSGLGGFDLLVEHSGDGRHFSVVKGVTAAAGAGDVSIGAPLATTATNLGYGYSNPNIPLLGYVRFRMFFSNATTAAHVRVHVTQRDQT